MLMYMGPRPIHKRLFMYVIYTNTFVHPSVRKHVYATYFAARRYRTYDRC